MKVILPHNFFLYAQNFTLQSMLREISYWAFSIFNNPDKSMGAFASRKSYSVMIGKKKVTGRCLIAQTWLIDMMYTLITNKNYGSKTINHNEALYLIDLYNDYSNMLDACRIRNSKNVLLNVYGFFGEQKRFQATNEFIEDFSREKYILDIISKKSHPQNIYNINIEKDILEATGFSSDDFSALMFLLFAYFSGSCHIVKKDSINIELKNSLFSSGNFINILDTYSITIDGIRISNLKRQVFYTHPIIKIDDIYIASNPFLLLSLFANSNYWVLRNLYMHKERDKQKFVNAFGCFFEIYVEELLNNCINNYTFEKIPEERNQKRADWYLNIDGIEFLVEQKSGLSLLGIKQNQTDIELMEKHIVKNWGEAVKQLDNTQKARKMKSPIKIILVYEDYYKSECLDELFKLDNSLINDKKYWLVTIREFEMLLMICHDDLELFKLIVREKDDSEITHSSQGRDLSQFFAKHHIYENKYLYDFNIMDRWNTINSLWAQG